MSETNSEIDYTKEAEGFPVEWELLAPGSQRWKEVLANTITDGLLQTATATQGYTEILLENDPRMASRMGGMTKEADASARQMADDLKLLRDLLNKPNNQVPIVKKYSDRTKDSISLSKLRGLEKLKLTRQSPAIRTPSLKSKS